MQATSHRFLRTHLIYPLLAWLACVGLIQVLNLDLFVADQLHTLEGGSWLLRNHWLVAGWLHDGAQDLARLLGLGLLLGFAFSQWRDPQGNRRTILLYLLLAMVSSAVIIAVAKTSLGVPCAWDVTGFGGSTPYLSIWDWGQLQRFNGGCFPSGHAGAGYAWVALYFVCLRFAPRWRWHGLLAALALGLTFGLAQQLRGAHFVSHDVWSLAICWCISLFWYSRFFASDLQRNTSHESRAIRGRRELRRAKVG